MDSPHWLHRCLGTDIYCLRNKRTIGVSTKSDSTKSDRTNADSDRLRRCFDPNPQPGNPNARPSNPI